MNLYVNIKNCNYMLFCGDFNLVIPNIKFDLICTSPPYNIGSKSPKKITNRKHGGYDSKSWGAIEHYDDALPEDEYQKQQYKMLQWCATHLSDSGVIVYNHKLRHYKKAIICPVMWFPPELQYYDHVVWDRGSTHNHCKNYVYQQHEELYVLKKRGCTPYFINSGHSSVWRITPAYNNKHNAPFPLELANRIIQLWCPQGGTVCDPYCGSGTTMIASLLNKRNFVGAELKSLYYKQAVERFREYASQI